MDNNNGWFRLEREKAPCEADRDNKSRAINLNRLLPASIGAGSRRLPKPPAQTQPLQAARMYPARMLPQTVSRWPPKHPAQA